MKVKVSYIIVNWNTKGDLKRCVESVLTHGAPVGVESEILVFDNNSKDGSADMVQGKFPEVRLIRHERNEGLAYGWNYAAGQARGDVLVLLNPDITLTPRCLEELLCLLRKRSEVGAVGPRLIDAGGETHNFGLYVKLPTLRQFICYRTPLRRLSERVSWLRTHVIGDHDPDETQRIEQPPGAFFMLRREVWNQIDGADDSFFLYYEDVDLARKVKDAGWELWYVSSAVALHRGGGTTKLVQIDERRLLFFTSACRYFDKYHGFWTGFLIMLIVQGNFFWITLRNILEPGAVPVYFDSAWHLLNHWRYHNAPRSKQYRTHLFQEENTR